MAVLTIGAAILSLITYYQNFGVVLSLRPVEPSPSRFDFVLNFFYRTFSAITSLIDSLPNYDLRIQLNFMVVIVPLLLDFGFMWVMCPKFKLYLHFLDAIALGIFCYGISIVIFCGNSQQATSVALCAVGGVFLLAHFLITRACKVADPPPKWLTLKTLARGVCEALVEVALTDRESEYSLEDICDELAEFSDLVHILPSTPSPFLTLVMFVAGIGLLFVGIWSLSGVALGAATVPAAFALWLPFCAIPGGAVLLIVSILRMTERGRAFITKAKEVMRRYGLRVVILLLQTLYLPVIALMIDLLLPSTFGCGDNFYLRYTYEDGALAPFVVRPFECAPCGINLSDQCEALCHIAAEDAPWRIELDPGLLYVEDSLKAVGIAIGYAFLAVVIGIPIFFWQIISTNQKIVGELLVWGMTSTEKWNNVLSRVCSSGVALFSDFQYAHVNWAILQLLTKLGVMLISVLQARLTEHLAYLFPLWYILIGILTWRKMPYRRVVNNILEIWTFFLLAGFTIVPLAERNDAVISSTTETAILVVFLILPFGAFLSRFCVRGASRVSADDPTLMANAEKEELKFEKDALVVKEWRDKGKGQGEIVISYSSIQSVKEQFKEELDSSSTSDEYEDEQEGAQYNVSAGLLAKQMTRMYRIVDLVLDGATVELLMKVLSAAVVLSSIGFGFYLGFVTNTALPEKVIC
jgi:hypothetical protein